MTYFVGLHIGGLKGNAPKITNNNGLAWGIVDGKYPKNPCGVEYDKEEVEKLGNVVNLYNCPSGPAFVKGITKPYQITSVIYGKYNNNFDRDKWLTGLRSAYHSYFDMWDYLKSGASFKYFDSSDYASLYIEIYGSKETYCIGPELTVVEENGNSYSVKGGQERATSFSPGVCDGRISAAEKAQFKITVG